MKRVDMRGVSLMELMFVVALSGIMMGIAGFTAQGFIDRYDAERQVRQMHSDMINARDQAFMTKMAHFVIVTSSGYQIVEDTNESGGNIPGPGDRTWWPAPKQFKFPSQWNGTIVMNTNGIIAKSTGALLSNAALPVRFETAGIMPEYDCISVGPTRIRAGRLNGMKCVTR